MHFRFLFILFAAGVFLRIPAAAEFSLAADVEVGTEPGQMFYYNGYFHVFCMGHDANSNQQYDEGDEYPSLWKISEADPASSPKKIMEFPIDDIKIGTDYSFDPTSGIVYKTYNDTLQAVNLNTETIEKNILPNIQFNHFAVDGTDKIEIRYHQILSRSYFVRSSISSNEGTLIDSIERLCFSIRPFTTDDSFGFAALGSTFKSGLEYDSVEAYIFKYDILDTTFSSLSIDTIFIGTDANAIEVVDNKIYVLENMSKNLFTIDIDTGEIIDTQKIDAPSDYGINLLSVNDGKAAIVLHDEDYSQLRDSKLQVFALGDYDHKQEFDLDGIAEYVQFADNSIAVSLFKMPEEGQIPPSKVAIYKETTSALDKEIDNMISISPNPVTNNLSIDCNIVNLNIKTIEIYSADARLIQTIDTFGEMQSNSKFSINCSNLSSGVYYAVFKTDDKSFSKQFVVAR